MTDEQYRRAKQIEEEVIELDIQIAEMENNYRLCMGNTSEMSTREFKLTIMDRGHWVGDVMIDAYGASNIIKGILDKIKNQRKQLLDEFDKL